MGNERLHLRSPNIHICHVISISGEINEDKFTKAVEALGRRHIILTCALRPGDNHSVFYAPHTTAIGVEIYDDSEMEWADWYEKADARPFDFEKGPLVKFCLIRKKDGADIIIFGHHIIADGFGYYNMFRDFFKALDGGLDETPLKPLVDLSLKTAVVHDPIKAYLAKHMNAAWRESRKSFTQKEFEVFFYKYRAKNVPDMYLDSFDRRELAALISKSKEIGVTVNSMLCTAFALALKKCDHQYAHNDIGLGVPVNIRDDINVPLSGHLGNFSTGISVSVEFDASSDFAGYVRTVNQKIRAKLANPQDRYETILFVNALDKDFLESVYFAEYGDYDNPISKKLAQALSEKQGTRRIGLTNLGVQDFGVYNSFCVQDVLAIPPAFPSNLLTVSAMTLNGQMNICIRFLKSSYSYDIIEEIFGTVKKYCC